jgi:hypothetical protein
MGDEKAIIPRASPMSIARSPEPGLTAPLALRAESAVLDGLLGGYGLLGDRSIYAQFAPNVRPSAMAHKYGNV